MRGALEAAEGFSAAPASVLLHEYDKFCHFKVICSNTSRRFLLQHEPRQSVILRVVKLTARRDETDISLAGWEQRFIILAV